MERYLSITIDVEPDCSPNWHYSNPLTFEGVSTGIKEMLQPLFNKYSMVPTYLINNVVLEDEKSISVFKLLGGNYELGTHLHCEFIEPEKRIFDYSGKKGEANQCFLPPEIEFEKMKNITSLFEAKFNKKPTSFRAGRFSAGINTINSLRKLGYKVDTSVTPHITWKDKTRETPVSYISAPEQPYFIKNDSFLEKAENNEIMEVPVTIGYVNTFWGKKIKWLRPVYSSYTDFTKLVYDYSIKYSTNKIVVFNLMFHNVEVLPGKSPYTKTEKDCLKYLKSLGQLFSFCNENDIRGINLSGVYDLFK